jgi:hypothetical protein
MQTNRLVEKRLERMTFLFKAAEDLSHRQHVISINRMLELFNELSACQAGIEEINLIYLCKLGDDEVRHTAILAWLLNNRENHGMGNRFFKALLDLCKKTVVDAEGSYRVITEFAKQESVIDILVYQRKGFAVYVEHKVTAAEGPEQLNREYRDLQRLGNEQEIHPDLRIAIFLTPEGRPPASGDSSLWVHISHCLLAAAFEPVIESMPTGKARWFIEDWVNTIKMWR